MTVLDHLTTRAKALVALVAAVSTMLVPMLVHDRITFHDWINTACAAAGVFGVHHVRNTSDGTLKYAKGLTHGGAAFIVLAGTFAQSSTSGIANASAEWWQVLVVVVGTLGVVLVRNKMHSEVSR